MLRELKIFLTSILFFTRIPVHSWFTCREEYLNKASRYFPLVGLLVGGIGAGVFWLTNLIFPVSVAVVLSTVATIWTTGAFHEDGFGDVCDAFGGGWTPEKILDIMKDSRVGAYGALGMFMMILTKILTLSAIPAGLIPFTLVSGHALSRWASTSMLHSHEYVTENDRSKSKPLARQMSHGDLIISLVFALIPAYWNPFAVGAGLLAVFLVKVLMARFFNKWIGGYTGDCLGAIQQMAEVVYYLVILAIFG